MIDLKKKKIKATEVCTIERVKKGKVYKAGTCFVKLSATDETIEQLACPFTWKVGYAALVPFEGINPEYFFATMCHSFPDFLRHFRTNISLQFDALENLELLWHESKETQEYIGEVIKKIYKESSLLDSIIDQEKTLKKWCLSKMFVSDGNNEVCNEARS